MNKAYDNRGYMIGIDLHGVKHKDVERKVHDAICQMDLPFIVITGHSTHMRNLVREAVELWSNGREDWNSNSGYQKI